MQERTFDFGSMREVIRSNGNNPNTPYAYHDIV